MAIFLSSEAMPRPRLSPRGLASMGALYLLFGGFYATTIAFNVRKFQPHALADYLSQVLLFDYPLKALWTLPVWWLLFRGPLRPVRWPVRLLAHGVLAPLWVAAWAVSYNVLLRGLGRSGLSGDARIWDIYIPALFYGVQFGVLHVAEFAQQIRWQSHREQQLRDQAHLSEVATLKAQLNPHFLFNTLNSISASVPPELEATRELIARLAHTLRFALAASRQERLPLGEEIAFLQDYLRLEQARFGDRLQVSFAVAPALLAVPVPPMLLQPLVENALRHGLASLVAGGAVAICVQPQGTALRVTVTDTGVGLRGQPLASLLTTSAGLGLRNTHARLRVLGSAGLEIAENQPHGLRIGFVLPLPTRPTGWPAPAKSSLPTSPALR